MFNFKKLIESSTKYKSYSYERRLEFLLDIGREVGNIKTAVEGAERNLLEGKRSFVIYGEPQSGKTEMMIALTAKLLDMGYKYVVVLLNDSVALLDQNLTRFRKANLSTQPVIYKELQDHELKIESQARIIFSKKNASDLKKLNEMARKIEDIVIIDDEADYATPNSKVNKEEVSKINELTSQLLKSGIYIGVTATPARLDLNNTHLNEPEYWIDYPSHKNYTGQDVFFPDDITQTNKFKLALLPDAGDNPSHLKIALFNFLINSAYLNIKRDAENYIMLIHTSGKKNDHSQDWLQVSKIINELSDDSSHKRENHYRDIWEIANKLYSNEADDIVEFILANIESHYSTVMNSDHTSNSAICAEPPSPFTIIIGGNTISRGVTFNNLLSMFFTRDAKHKLQQDTYIQRARMFGSRGTIIEYFELSIPKSLYTDWRRAFIFHRLSLESRKSGNGIPIWHEDLRIKVASSNSIDSSRVSFERGEMSFNKFRYDNHILKIMNEECTDFDKIEKMHSLLSEEAFPSYIVSFINSMTNRVEGNLVIHEPRSIMGMDEKYADYTDISRNRGLIAGKDLESRKKPNASHHIFVFYNNNGEARVIYKFNENVSFIKGKK